jgi:signal transduction histidine kinase
MASLSTPSPTPQERWHQFSAATVRAFHRYATWLVSLSWWRFGWYSLLLLMATGLIQKLPPFSMTYYETVVDSVQHRKGGRDRAMPAPAAPSAPAAPMVDKPERPEKPELPEKPEKPQASADSKSVNINLPGIVVNTKDHSVRNRGVNISFGGNGIHISTDDDPADVAAAAASAAKAAALAASAASAAQASALAQSNTAAGQAKAAAAQATAQALVAAKAASAAASAAEAAVDIVVDGQHVRISVPSEASGEDVRDALNEAKDAIVQSLREQEEQRRDAAREAADAARAATDAAKAGHEGDDEDASTDDDGNHSTLRTHTVHYGDLPLLAVWWILASMLVKVTYKGRMQAEVKAAAATETAEAESLRRQVLEARMAMMQAQVEPHFLFNTLASIDHLIEFDPKRASQMQRNLISLLRASMPSMRTATDSGVRPLELELAVVRPYLEILKVRMEERLTTDIAVPDGLLSAEFPPMMIQTLVENSIKHGLEPKPEGGHLSVKAEIRHGKLCVVVCDTGLGFTAAAGGDTAGTGVGLANIRERLSLLYGSKGSLTIANNPVGGTIVTITVPYTAHTESDSSNERGATA